MSENIRWKKRHGLTGAQLRRLADALDELNEAEPLIGTRWAVDVIAPQQVWDIYDSQTPTVIPGDD
jgi:hypothetical protein